MFRKAIKFGAPYTNEKRLRRFIKKSIHQSGVEYSTNYANTRLRGGATYNTYGAYIKRIHKNGDYNGTFYAKLFEVGINLRTSSLDGMTSQKEEQIIDEVTSISQVLEEREIKHTLNLDKRIINISVDDNVVWDLDSPMMFMTGYVKPEKTYNFDKRTGKISWCSPEDDCYGRYGKLYGATFKKIGFEVVKTHYKTSYAKYKSISTIRIRNFPYWITFKDVKRLVLNDSGFNELFDVWSSADTNKFWKLLKEKFS